MCNRALPASCVGTKPYIFYGPGVCAEQQAATTTAGNTDKIEQEEERVE